MFKIIENKNYNICNFLPFKEYIKNLETNGVKITYIKEKYDWLTIKFICNNIMQEIIIYNDNNMEWATIYKYHNIEDINTKYEQIEFIESKEENMDNNNLYNRVIRYSAHFEDEEYCKIITSGYLYNNNNLINGWREKRKFPKEELAEIVYQGMNLTELTINADEKIFDFYEFITEKNDEVKELKLYY